MFILYSVITFLFRKGLVKMHILNPTFYQFNYKNSKQYGGACACRNAIIPNKTIIIIIVNCNI